VYEIHHIFNYTLYNNMPQASVARASAEACTTGAVGSSTDEGQAAAVLQTPTTAAERKQIHFAERSDDPNVEASLPAKRLRTSK
jgi:hypothetical protein